MNCRYHTYRATPTIRLLESLSARGSTGSAISPHSCEMSAIRTERLGNFLNDDFAPKVAASLQVTVLNDANCFYHAEYSPKEAESAVSTRQKLRCEEHGMLL